MKKVAIFGNAGGGKSTLAKRLNERTGLPLYSLDKIKYQEGGRNVPHAEYLHIHSKLLAQETWIIDGFGCVPSAWERFSVADTLIYVDLPLPIHAWWVTKRFLKGIFINPEGWPKGSPIIKGTINSYRVLWACHTKLTPSYRLMASEYERSKRVYHLKSSREIAQFIDSIWPDTE